MHLLFSENFLMLLKLSNFQYFVNLVVYIDVNNKTLHLCKSC